MLMHDLVTRIERLRVIDRVAAPLADAAHRALPPGTVAKDALSGTWLGHPLHPLLTDIPIGCFTSASIVDVVGGRRGRRSADRLLALGLLSAVPTAAAGLADWSETTGETRRLGVVHALANTVGLGFYAKSYWSRKRGQRARGVAQALIGMGAMTAGGYLGAHLTFTKGIGVNATFREHGPHDWVTVLAASGLPEDRLVRVEADGVALVLRRRGDRVDALSATCTHAGGPLDEGELVDGCVRCPWHGSMFRLATGEVVHGPATAPEPAYDARLVSDKVEVRRREQ
ncbi:MAG: iron-sulfur protein [Acidimicrobiales bacterium]|jgi:nitrite reductase/ring-hydroxylating ferredoxin subunit/uncharacterized membrane protein|nr:iron-sulfur protein [Acidimicrobiales bacterium]